ncbi:transaldolase family protein [Streptomyces gamaensis]|uniref:Transaldolase n=1 Tax=Streptomyces gamaensis TaxID=1763542 RepID=A0ABW0ZAK6_9ACTN
MTVTPQLSRLPGTAADASLRALTRGGVSVWLDQRPGDGPPAALVRGRYVTGVLHDPARLTGPAREGPLRKLARRGLRAEAALRALTVHDVRWACDMLRPVHEATAGVDGLVALALDPRLAHDAAATLREARRLWRATDRPNAVLAVPATDAGLDALAAALAEGINAGATHVFTPERYEQAAEAYLTGLAGARAAGRHPATLASFAAVPVTPLDTAVDALLDRDGTCEAKAMRGTAAVSTARLVHERHERLLDRPRWHALAARGARPQRLLWTATCVRDPVLPATRYADRLTARGTACALTEETLRAVADHGRAVPRSWGARDYADARRLLGHLDWFGIDRDALARRLESESLRAAEARWHALLDSVETAVSAPGELPRAEGALRGGGAR